MTLKSKDVTINICQNKVADSIYISHYWLKRIRRSRRISYVATYKNKQVAWVQCADPFGTKLTKSLQSFSINDAIELCRGYFIEDTPSNMESCVISKVLRHINNDWYNQFREIKKIAIVYQDLDANQRGIVYKAVGFKPYAKCGNARHYSVPTRGNSRGNKIVWAKPLRPVNGKHYKVRINSECLTFEEVEKIEHNIELPKIPKNELEKINDHKN